MYFFFTDIQSYSDEKLVQAPLIFTFNNVNVFLLIDINQNYQNNIIANVNISYFIFIIQYELI